MWLEHHTQHALTYIANSKTKVKDITICLNEMNKERKMQQKIYNICEGQTILTDQKQRIETKYCPYGIIKGYISRQILSRNKLNIKLRDSNFFSLRDNLQQSTANTFNLQSLILTEYSFFEDNT